MKFHGILHMTDVILNFGVPLKSDTECNESHHVPTKKLSQLTQKGSTRVEEQTSERTTERDVLALVHAEMVICEAILQILLSCDLQKCAQDGSRHIFLDVASWWDTKAVGICTLGFGFCCSCLLSRHVHKTQHVP